MNEESVELDYCSSAEAESAFALISELRKMLNALRRSLLAKRDG
jgi:hypothetical protein